MKRLLTLLVVLALMGYLAFKGGVWWLADQRLAEADRAVDDIGVIDHGQIRSDISGSLTLVDGFYEDFRLSRPLKVGRLTFDAGSPVALVNALLDPSALPSQWRLRGEQLSMTLDNALLSNWVTESGEPGTPPLFAPVCGPNPQQRLSTVDLLGLGIARVTGEVLLRQDASQVYGEITTAETGSLEVLWPGARFNPLDPMALMTSSTQPVSVTLRDGGLMRRISAYCSREAGMETDQWLDVATEAFRAGLADRGFRASDQLVALYRQWLTEGGELGLELRPGEPLWGVPEGASAPFVTYNGSRVPDVYLEQLEVAPEPAESAEPAEEKPAAQAPGWQVADKAEAAGLIGQTVRVTLANGNVVEGRLAAVSEERMEVARLVDGGEVAYPIATRLIDGFEVWRRGQTP